MILGFCRRPFPDELLYGYLSSLFRHNSIFTMKHGESLLGARICIYYSTGLSVMCNRVRNPLFPDALTALQMTPYSVLSHGKSDGSAARLAEMYLQSEGTHATSLGRAVQKSEIRLCPHCFAEDTTIYGEPYLHLSHHLPGVGICARHNCTLLRQVVPSKRTPIRPLSLEHAEPIKTGCTDLEQVSSFVEVNHQNTESFVKSRCPRCKREYWEHSYSRKTACGCPYCNQNEDLTQIITRRLKTIANGEYTLTSVYSDLASGTVTHIPCGSTTKKLLQILYGEQLECADCKALEPERLQMRFDPEQKHWQFFPVSDYDRQRKRIRVRHLDCGHEYHVFMASYTSRNDGYCPYCHNPQKQIDIGDVAPDYSVESVYLNNKSSIVIKHLSCGVSFLTSKNTFLAGRRCPLCTNRTTFLIAKEIAQNCLPPEYTVEKDESRRGYVILETPSKGCISLDYQTLLLELSKERSDLFPDRISRYVEPISSKKQIWDNILHQTEKKGFWSFYDGLIINGVLEVTDPAMPGGISRIRRNMIQDMAKQGWIERCGIGQYRTCRKQ